MNKYYKYKKIIIVKAIVYFKAVVTVEFYSKIGNKYWYLFFQDKLTSHKLKQSNIQDTKT